MHAPSATVLRVQHDGEQADDGHAAVLSAAMNVHAVVRDRAAHIARLPNVLRS